MVTKTAYDLVLPSCSKGIQSYAGYKLAPQIFVIPCSILAHAALMGLSWDALYALSIQGHEKRYPRAPGVVVGTSKWQRKEWSVRAFCE